MRQSFEQHGLPQAMLLDHGVPWWSVTNGHGLTQFAVRLIEQGIALLYGRPYHPQTRGKIERFHRTLDLSVRHRGKPQEFAPWPVMLEEFRQQYNQQRPHAALGMQPPARRYQPSPRAYQAEPPPWAYPAGATVRRLNAQGCLEWAGQRWFVCEALSTKQVRVQSFLHEDRVLVSYRHLYIRELDLRRGTSASVVLPAAEG